MDYLSAECGLAANTIKAYRRDLVGYADFLSAPTCKHPQRITADDVLGYLRFRKEQGAASSSLGRYLAAVKMLHRYLMLVNIVQTPVADILETPRKWRNLPDVLNARQIERLLTAPDPARLLGLRDRAILQLFYASGLRASELAELPTDAINFSFGFLRCIGKGRKERIVPIHKEALAAIREYLLGERPKLARVPASNTLFLSRTGKPLTRESLWRIVGRHAKTAGLGHVHPHQIRHSFATHLLAGGADLRVIQELLGHADIATTQIYTHVDSSRLKSVHRKYHPRG